MTDDKIALRTLLEKGSDATFLREMIGFAAQRWMELGSEALCGAGHGERSAERRTQRRYHDAPGDGGRPASEAIMDQSKSVGPCSAAITVLVAIELSTSAWVLAVHD